MEHEGESDTNCSLNFWNDSQKPRKKNGDLGKNWNSPDHRITEISLNSQKSKY